MLRNVAVSARFSNMGHHQNHLEALLNQRLLAPTLRDSESVDPGPAVRICVLTCFCVRLMLLVQGPHFADFASTLSLYSFDYVVRSLMVTLVLTSQNTIFRKPFHQRLALQLIADLFSVCLVCPYPISVLPMFLP